MYLFVIYIYTTPFFQGEQAVIYGFPLPILSTQQPFEVDLGWETVAGPVSPGEPLSWVGILTPVSIVLVQHSNAGMGESFSA